MKTKKVIALVAVLVVLFVGIYAVKFGYDNHQITNVDVTALEPEDHMKNKEYAYKKGDAILSDDPELNEAEIEGVTDLIVAKNVTERNSANDVASIVFDFRGYDTIGEALILSTAICGSFCILYIAKKDKKGGQL